jgi:hypothetical protein
MVEQIAIGQCEYASKQLFEQIEVAAGVRRTRRQDEVEISARLRDFLATIVARLVF